jgi:hypothetical protein
MSVDNPLWGAPRIHGELLKLGFEIAQPSVAKYMVKRCEPPSPGWRTFLRNHAPDIAAMDLFVQLAGSCGCVSVSAETVSGLKANLSGLSLGRGIPFPRCRSILEGPVQMWGLWV